ncbi:MAG: sulfatase-like hydrolase/transferase [Polyangiaceae bacterium]
MRLSRQVVCVSASALLVSSGPGCDAKREAVPAAATTTPTPLQSAAPPPSSSAPGTASSAALAKPRAKRPYSVLLIMVDSMRADMPWNGYPRDIAPHLTRTLSESCITYTQGYSLSSYTAKSVVPALVGEYPAAMKRDGYFFTRYPDADNLFISERAQKAGINTLSGQAHGYFLPALGNNQGFDHYRLIEGGVDLKAVTSVTGERLATLAKSMLGEFDPGSENRRFFAYFHFMDPHHTYVKHKGHPDFGNKPRDVYDTEMHYTDAWLHDLLEFARGKPWWKDTVTIITADHGEGFGERGHMRHAYELWESLVKVPLAFCVPGLAPRKVEDVRRGHIDLAPTIADLLGLPASPPFRGESLVPELFAEVPTKPKTIVVDLPRSDLMDRRRAVIADDWKIVGFGDDKQFMLFDLNKDPWESDDLATKRPDKLEAMKQLYFAESAKIPNVEVVGGPALKGAPPGRRW